MRSLGRGLRVLEAPAPASLTLSSPPHPTPPAPASSTLPSPPHHPRAFPRQPYCGDGGEQHGAVGVGLFPRLADGLGATLNGLGVDAAHVVDGERDWCGGPSIPSRSSALVAACARWHKHWPLRTVADAVAVLDQVVAHDLVAGRQRRREDKERLVLCDRTMGTREQSSNLAVLSVHSGMHSLHPWPLSFYGPCLSTGNPTLVFYLFYSSTANPVLVFYRTCLTTCETTSRCLVSRPR